MFNLLCRLKLILSRLFFRRNKSNTNVPAVINVGRGHSLFKFVRTYCKGDTSHNFAFHRLCSLMRKMDVKTAVIEKIGVLHGDIADECNALFTYFGKQIKISAYRITFVSRVLSEAAEVVCLENGDFLASSIIINYEDPDDASWNSYLYGAVVTIPKIRNNPQFGDLPLLNNYLHVYKTFRREIALDESRMHGFEIMGTFFCQQNEITSVCAHASLRMIINNIVSGTITSENVNKIIGVDHTIKSFGKKTFSFTEQEFDLVLRQYGFTYDLRNFFNNPHIDYNDYIYNYIESRCPILFTFTTDVANEAHVVPILGHTLNTDLWRPEAETAYAPKSTLEVLKSASAWVDHFIMHDDNFGMYFCLPVDTFKGRPAQDPTFKALYAIAIIPAEVTTSPDEAKPMSSILAIDILKWCENNKIMLDTWSNLLLKRLRGRVPRPITIRTFLVTRDQYLKSLSERDFENAAFSNKDKQELIADLPHRFWLSEITLPYLYTANKSKIIDFCYKCDNPKLQDPDDIYSRWLQMRLPGVLIKRDNSGNLTPYELTVKSHYPLLRLDHENDVLDW